MFAALLAVCLMVATTATGAIAIGTRTKGLTRIAEDTAATAGFDLSAYAEKLTDLLDVELTGDVAADVGTLLSNAKLYNVLIDGVTSLHPCSEYRSNSAVRIGDKAYADTDSELGDTHDVTVRNIISSATFAVSLCKGLANSTIENVTVLDGQTGISAFPKTTATLKNCRIENILTLSESSVAINTDGITFID